MESIIAVKPSSPTPPQLQNHKISAIDQVGPQVYVPLIFFYQNIHSQHHKSISQRLMQSLSHILTVFYPLAGIIKQNTFIDCNDRGAVFVEARIHAPIHQFIQNPKMEELKQLIPIHTSSFTNDAFHLLVKLNFFDCGGIAVGVCFLHKIGDTSSFVTFMNAWAADCRGEPSRIISPSFNISLRFPPKYLLSFATRIRPGITNEKIITRRLVFEREMLERLKEEAASEEVMNPSRVEAVTAFIWRSFIEFYKARGTTSFTAAHMVNLRPRSAPPLPDHAFGNCFGFASAVVGDGSDGKACVSKLRSAIIGVDANYIDKVSKSLTFFVMELLRSRNWSKAGNCTFTSWSRFPVYDVDFGWGKPVWVSTTTMPYPNLVVLMSTPSGDGIEAWVNCPSEEFFWLIRANYDKLLN